MTKQTFFKYKEKTTEMLTDYLLKTDANSIYLKKSDYDIVDVDEVLDVGSNNPVTNSVITAEINKKISNTDFEAALDSLIQELSKQIIYTLDIIKQSYNSFTLREENGN